MNKDIEYVLVSSLFFTPLRWIPPIAHRVINKANYLADYCNQKNSTNPDYSPLPEILLFTLVWLAQMFIWFGIPLWVLSGWADKIAGG